MNIWFFFIECMITLRSSKVKTALMTLGTTIGIGALTLIMSISAGSDREIRRQVARFGDRAILVLPGHGPASRTIGSETENIRLKPADAQAIADSVKGIEGICSTASQYGQSVKVDQSQIKSNIDAVESSWHHIWEWNPAFGQPIDQRDVDQAGRVCLLGTTVKQELFGNGDPLGQDILIGSVRFRVKGILESKGITGSAHDRDDRVVIPITTGMKRLFNQQHISNIRARVQKGYDLDQTAAQITDLLNRRHRIDPAFENFFTVLTTSSLIRQFKGLSDIAAQLLFALTGLSLIAGGLVFMNTMLVFVSERKAEIGLRRAVGARSRDIFMQFLFEAMCINVTGLVSGWALGFSAAALVHFLSDIPIALSIGVFLLGGLLSVSSGILFGIQPARRASRLNPVEALR